MNFSTVGVIKAFSEAKGGQIISGNRTAKVLENIAFPGENPHAIRVLTNKMLPNGNRKVQIAEFQAGNDLKLETIVYKPGHDVFYHSEGVRKAPGTKGSGTLCFDEVDKNGVYSMERRIGADGKFKNIVSKANANSPKANAFLDNMYSRWMSFGLK